MSDTLVRKHYRRENATWIERIGKVINCPHNPNQPTETNPNQRCDGTVPSESTRYSFAVRLPRRQEMQAETCESPCTEPPAYRPECMYVCASLRVSRSVISMMGGVVTLRTAASKRSTEPRGIEVTYGRSCQSCELA